MESRFNVAPAAIAARPQPGANDEQREPIFLVTGGHEELPQLPQLAALESCADLQCLVVVGRDLSGLQLGSRILMTSSPLVFIPVLPAI